MLIRDQHLWGEKKRGKKQNEEEKEEKQDKL